MGQMLWRKERGKKHSQNIDFLEIVKIKTQACFKESHGVTILYKGTFLLCVYRDLACSFVRHFQGISALQKHEAVVFVPTLSAFRKLYHRNSEAIFLTQVFKGKISLGKSEFLNLLIRTQLFILYLEIGFSLSDVLL